jgi:hypothetical protein
VRTSSAILCVLVAACGGKKDEAKKQLPRANVVAKHKIDHARMTVPEGWTSSYDAEHDGWVFASPAGAEGHQTDVTLQRTPPETTASPDALLHVLKTRVWGPDVTGGIVERKALSDGFAATIEATRAGTTTREIYVVKELGSEWFVCASTGADDTTREQALALCKSIKR